MSFETWAAFAAATAVLLVIPGPTILLVISYALGQGWRTALPMAVGVALGDFTAMTLSMLGVGALLATSAAVFTALKWVGAAYLVYLGIKLFRAGGTLDAKPRAGCDAALAHARPCLAGDGAEPEGHHLLRRLPAAVPRCRSRDFWTQMLIFEATFVTLAFANAFGYALIASRARSVDRQSPRHRPVQQGRRHAAGRRRHRDRRDPLGPELRARHFAAARRQPLLEPAPAPSRPIRRECRHGRKGAAPATISRPLSQAFQVRSQNTGPVSKLSGLKCPCSH